MTAPPDIETPLCREFGFDTQTRLERLALMGITDADHALLETLQREAIQPHCTAIMDDFYQFLFSFPEMHPYLGHVDNIERLKTTQQEYLTSFGLNYQHAAYFEYRLRIGIAHERIGMPLHLYLAAYRQMQQLIVRSLPATTCSDPGRYAQCIDCISKIIMLDMSLAIDTYSHTRVEIMTESIHALSRERDTLSNQLMRDTLTGTLSRRFILETLNKQLAQLARQSGHGLCVAMLDLDHFKQVNDAYGHLVGDKVLYEFAKVVSSRVRENDYFGRFGGEEFLLILTEIPLHTAELVLNRIREATQEQVFASSGKRIPLTVSIGVTAARPDDKVDDLIDRADTALYQAKLTGRNKVVVG